jgi:hypothetical protein
MRTLAICLAAAILSLLLTSSAKAVVLLSDNFDSYATQADFNAAWPVTTSSTSGALSTAQAFSGTKSILYPASGTLAGYRNIKSFGDNAASATNSIEFSLRFYDTNSTLNNFREYGEMIDAAGTGNGQLIALGLNNNVTSTSYMARIVGEDGGQGAGAFFKLDGGGVPTRSVGWHQLKAVVSTTAVQFYVDGVASKNVLLANTGSAGRAYDAIRLGSNLSSTSGGAFFDDVSVQTVAVPEPSTLALAAAGGLMFVRRRRR